MIYEIRLLIYVSADGFLTNINNQVLHSEQDVYRHVIESPFNVQHLTWHNNTPMSSEEAPFLSVENDSVYQRFSPGTKRTIVAMISGCELLPRK